MCLTILITIAAVLLATIVVCAFKSAEPENRKPRFRGWKNVQGNVVADWRSDDEIRRNANRLYK
jgi:hypothetical protein